MRFLPLFLMLLFAGKALPKDRYLKEHIEFEGRKRTYYMYIPGSLDSSKPAPLLVTLHPLGGNGADMLDLFTQLATLKKFIIVSPNAIHSWQGPDDWPDFLHALVESIKTRFNIDARRVYLFGNSAGACFAAVTALLEPGYFAAIAVRAGILPMHESPPSDNRVPVGFWVGERDSIFTMKAVKDTAIFMYEKGFKVRMTVMPGLDHAYGRSSPGTDQTNQDVWSFLESHVLCCTPEWIAIRHMRRQLWPWPPWY
jgi:poly(3-hydroxybutyrate) depolymerase